MDLTSPGEISSTYLMLASKVARRLRKAGLKGDVIQISVRDKDLNIYEKQKILISPTDSSQVIHRSAVELFEALYDWHVPVRSIGVRVTNLRSADAPEQMNLFENLETKKKNRKLEDIIDAIKDRYGKDSLKFLGEIERNFDTKEE